ncbi:unnamed protein product [Candida verbasci]|uniref:AB hydrolase-1 domain-containing protein n=1 Tax=Candida verbasci TaxID=1227364 RepID=A0A9W4TWS8_9ASCO|nr:unnamed protein product [Candida verbasci]
MASLVSDSTKTMGSPTESISKTNQNDTKKSSHQVNSITYFKSFKDWWDSPRQLIIDTKTDNSVEKFKQSTHNNKLIEYDLFKSILNEDIYIIPPGQTHESKSNKIGQLLDIELDDGTVIHEFYLQNRQKLESEIHIVIIHGYMAALGYFIKNIEELLLPGVHLHLIDLPGFGNSMRPKFPKEFLDEPESTQDKIRQISNIENWFIDRIENWRIIRKLERFKLIAHSMGAYLSCCYLMKYNKGKDIVKEFVIVSPMGTESSESSLITHPKYQNFHEKIDPFEELHFEEEEEGEDVYINEELTYLWSSLGKPKFPKNLILSKLWQYHKSPFEILQKTGPVYSKILSYWSFQRFKNFSGSGDTIDLILKLHDYSYSIFNQFQGSGELAITKLISSEILAKLPLADRGFIDYIVNEETKVLWIYGEHDWMNSKGGEYIHKKINERSKLSSFEIVEKAGHHIYLDNSTKFNQLILNFFNLNNQMD